MVWDMRADARVLLERLGKSDFRYREFVDRFADLESWPIFEALLKDPRIMPQEEMYAIEAAEPGDSLRQPAPRAQAPLAEPAPRKAHVPASHAPASDAPAPVVPAAPAVPVNPVAGVAPAPVTTIGEGAGGGVSSLFGRYGRPERAQNIRSLLQRLSDAVEGGDA